MTLPPPAPAYQRAVFSIALLVLLVVIAAVAGSVPMFRRWFNEMGSRAR